MSASVNERFTISPLLAFFVFHAIQWGIGYFSFQRVLVEAVGQDAWIVVLMAGISFHIVIWMLYQILNAHQSDIVHIHRKLFGKWLGGDAQCFPHYLFRVVGYYGIAFFY